MIADDAAAGRAFEGLRSTSTALELVPSAHFAVPSRCTYAITVEKQSGAGWPVTVEITQEEMLPRQIAGVLTLALDELRADVDPRAYGERLGRALFWGGVRDAFIRALAGRVDPLHVLLTLEADELRPLAWEYLCGPLGEGDDFLGLDQRVAYSRFLPSGVTRQFRPLRREGLRALVVVANPAGLADYRLQPFDARAALDAATAALAMPIDVLGNFPAARGPATLDALCEALTQGEYPILHVVAHGQFIATRSESVVYLENAEGHVEPCSQTKLSERLGVLASGLPHFAFFASCESASEASEASAGSLAGHLVAVLGIPAVVAMSRRVSIATAHAFTAAFYRCLLRHGHVDQALVEATAGLRGRPDVLVPALYGRLGAKPLFSIRSESGPDPTRPTGDEPRGDDLLGVVIDARYRVLRQLGRGGMGTVYEVEHVKLGQGRALKFMREEFRNRPGAARRFKQEARTLSTLSHPHVVSVLDMGEYKGRAFYVMELLTGEDLRIRARREGPFTWARARAIALQICEALVAVHANGIVHRDLKPSNCFCMQLPRDADFIKLLDFGVAWAPLPKGDSTPLSRSGEVFGTVTYMAPEQMDGVSAPSVDIYALGVMMYELLTGKLPFAGNDYAVIAEVRKTPPPSPREHRPDIAPEVEAIVLRALAKDPAARFATMQEFAAAIAAIPAESGLVAAAVPQPPQDSTAPLERPPATPPPESPLVTPPPESPPVTPPPESPPVTAPAANRVLVRNGVLRLIAVICVAGFLIVWGYLSESPKDRESIVRGALSLWSIVAEKSKELTKATDRGGALSGTSALPVDDTTGDAGSSHEGPSSGTSVPRVDETTGGDGLTGETDSGGVQPPPPPPPRKELSRESDRRIRSTIQAIDSSSVADCNTTGSPGAAKVQVCVAGKVLKVTTAVKGSGINKVCIQNVVQREMRSVVIDRNEDGCVRIPVEVPQK